MTASAFIDAIRAWNDLCQAPTTRQIADWCGVTRFRAADELDRLRRQRLIWSTLTADGRRWHLVAEQKRAA